MNPKQRMKRKLANAKFDRSVAESKVRKLEAELAKQSKILRILKKSAKFVDTYGGVHDKPTDYCDVTIVIYDEDPNMEAIKEWLEEKE